MARILHRCGNIFLGKKPNPTQPTNKPTPTNHHHEKKPQNQNHTNSTTRLLSSLRVFSNLVACNFSKKLEFGPPARPHWRTVTMSFLGLVGLCLSGTLAGLLRHLLLPFHCIMRWGTYSRLCFPLQKKPSISKVHVTTLQLDTSFPILIQPQGNCLRSESNHLQRQE